MSKALISEAMVGDVLDATERALHTRVIAKRDQEFAHSDSLSYEFPEWDYSRSTMHFYKVAFQPLTKEETRLLRAMIRKWIGHVDELRIGLKQSN